MSELYCLAEQDVPVFKSYLTNNEVEFSLDSDAYVRGCEQGSALNVVGVRGNECALTALIVALAVSGIVVKVPTGMLSSYTITGLMHLRSLYSDETGTARVEGNNLPSTVCVMLSNCRVLTGGIFGDQEIHRITPLPRMFLHEVE